MGMFGRSRVASYQPSSKELDRQAKQEAKEAAASQNRRERHRRAVFAQGSAASVPFDSERRGLFGRRKGGSW